MTAIEYTNELRKALQINLGQSNLYHGKEGCLRLAREYGSGLADYPKNERLNALRSSYSILCVRGYNLKPPIDAKEWTMAVHERMEYWHNKYYHKRSVY